MSVIGGVCKSGDCVYMTVNYIKWGGRKLSILWTPDLSSYFTGSIVEINHRLVPYIHKDCD